MNSVQDIAKDLLTHLNLITEGPTQAEIFVRIDLRALDGADSLASMLKHQARFEENDVVLVEALRLLARAGALKKLSHPAAA